MGHPGPMGAPGTRGSSGDLGAPVIVLLFTRFWSKLNMMADMFDKTRF